MLTVTDLAHAPDYRIDTVDCRDDDRRWSQEMAQDDHRIVLVRRGRFRRCADGVVSYVDPALAYLGLPGQDETFSHPCGGDLCTSIHMGRELWTSLVGDEEFSHRGPLYVDARIDVAHRRLYAAARDGDMDFALTEQLLRLLGELARQFPVGDRVGDRRSAADRAVLSAACEAIGAEHPGAADLSSLARLLGVSPFRLSRIFTRRLGVSLTRYRNRWRVAKALDLIELGEESLGGVAIRFGFADQAHLTRTVRQHCGTTPASLRRLLVSGAAPRSN